MRLRSGLTVLLLAAAALAVPSTAAAEGGCSTSSTQETAGQSAARRPVVLVHGWTADGSAMKGAGEALKKRTANRIQPFSFDYGPHSTTWAGDPVVAGCLARYISRVSAAWVAAGGDGKIILAGHSMGGLAALYAAPDTGGLIGGLITFDTPYLGSPFGDHAVAGSYQWVREQHGHKAAPAPGSNAQVCLAPHRDGAGLRKPCDAGLPPYLPVAAGVTAIAGDITVKRTFGPFDLYDIPLGSDGVVAVDSQHGYLQIDKKARWPMGQQIRLKTDSCTITNDSMMRTAKAAGRGGPGGLVSALLYATVELQADGNALDGLLADRLTPALIAYLGVAALTADCSHLKIYGHGPALDHAAASLTEYLDRLEPATSIRSLAPVTSAGTLAPGWTAVEAPDPGALDCGFNTASPSAKSDDIYRCSPDAAMADACWVESGHNSMLCLADPMGTTVVRHWMEGTADAAAPTGPAVHEGIPAPIRLDLDNGAHCRLRTGGSWSALESDPELVGFYRCDKGGAVWASRDSRTGIDQSGRTWTVDTADGGGLTRRQVRAAYYVATA
jgi:pimeloyl-ACP methyl ester carboxylesterase